jgi:ketosteroid isomerase-like protein
MSYLTLIRDTWENWRAEDVEIFDGGEDRAVAVYRVLGTGKTSSARVEHPIGVTFRLREGKLWRVRAYLDPGEALKAAGLAQ